MKEYTAATYAQSYSAVSGFLKSVFMYRVLIGLQLFINALQIIWS